MVWAERLERPDAGQDLEDRRVLRIAAGAELLHHLRDARLRLAPLARRLLREPRALARRDRLRVFEDRGLLVVVVFRRRAGFRVRGARVARPGVGRDARRFRARRDAARRRGGRARGGQLARATRFEERADGLSVLAADRVLHGIVGRPGPAVGAAVRRRSVRRQVRQHSARLASVRRRRFVFHLGAVGRSVRAPLVTSAFVSSSLAGSETVSPSDDRAWAPSLDAERVSS